MILNKFLKPGNKHEDKYTRQQIDGRAVNIQVDTQGESTSALGRRGFAMPASEGKLDRRYHPLLLL
jgi:hypothetical protein